MSLKKVYFHTLGCPKNLVDSEVLSGILQEGSLQEKQYEITKVLSDADIIIINTCSFISAAREETFEEIEKVVKYAKSGKGKKSVIVTGCILKNMDKEKLLEMFPKVDAFISPDEYRDFAKILTDVIKNKKHILRKSAGKIELFQSKMYQKRVLMTPEYFSYIKISDGCSNNCTYCSIPLIRGPLKSRGEKSLLEEIRILRDRGVKEFNLIGQDITAWGIDGGRKGGNLHSLLKRIVKIKGDFRVRLLYLHPKRIDSDLLDIIIGEEKLCSYIDMPIQHINDRILTLMNRLVKRRSIEKILSYARKKSDDIVLRTTLIVGFPGETKKEFEELYSFVKDSRFDRLGVFAYSEEPGTKACKFIDDISKKEKGRRLDKIMRLQEKIAVSLNKKKIGREMEVLVEGPADGGGFSCWGRSQYEAPDIDPIIYVRGNPEVLPGKIINVVIDGVAGYDLLSTELE
ncbi:MAG: 30S ribosomal protein S12 methylthiotransferase RimO [Candidatus Aureabacteria bacterium]|nr:30S ribosomal protein S12 methylthiotransferase RimO [Candidatus Auribacterota bacterium]